MTPSARHHLVELVRQEIRTVTGRPNTVLAVRENDMLVATAKSPNRQPVPIEWVPTSPPTISLRG
jgi:hypothetical protein